MYGRIFDKPLRQTSDKSDFPHRVFVYGTLMRGYGNHRLLMDPGAIRLGDDITLRKEYVMTGRGVPFVSDGGDAHIAGEVYDVTDAVLKRLDGLEGHPTFYERRIIPLGKYTEAWMYHHEPSGPEVMPVDGIASFRTVSRPRWYDFDIGDTSMAEWERGL